MTRKRDRSSRRRDSGKKRRPFSKVHPVAAGFLWDTVCFTAIAVAVLLVYHRAAGYFFAQDDFTSLSIAREAPKTFWRVFSSFVYFRALTSLFGLNPVAFHVASLLFHVANGVLVFLIARAFSVRRMTSLVGATLFVVHPALYVPVYAISSIGEILSCFFVMLATLYLLRTGRPDGSVSVFVVCILFAVSLLSKETTIAFPVLAVPILVWRRVRLKRTIPVLAALVAVAVAYAALFYSTDVFGIREALSGLSGAGHASAPGGAYATTLGPELITGLQTYFKWAFNIFDSWKDVQFNVLDKRALPWLFAGIALFLFLVGRRGSHRAKNAFCVSWFLLMLVPVIPLTGHPYHYYLYVPLAGLCPAFSVLLTRWFKRGTGERLASLCIIVFLLANSTLLMSRVEKTTVADSARRKDPVFDRPIVAKNLVSDIRELRLSGGTKLLLISPLEEILEGKITEHPYLVMGRSYWDGNVRSAVAEGEGIRLFFPQVDSVAFAGHMSQEYRRFLAVGYTWDGHLRFDTLRRPAP